VAADGDREPVNLRSPPIVILLAASMAVAGCATVTSATQGQPSDVTAARSRADRAVDVINQMNAQAGTAALLRNARAVLIVLDYVKVAFLIGEQGGEGVLAARHDDHWSDAGFYTLGGVSIGVQAGIEAGPVAYVLMTSRAVQDLENRESKTTLGADAGLTIIRFSGDTNIVSTLPGADVIVWTGTAGLFGGVAFDATHVVANRKLDEAYYHGPAPPHRDLSPSAGQ
jgi:SH3 domain-containing YSC84-like protein 1